jgi:predicted amidohydrolase
MSRIIRVSAAQLPAGVSGSTVAARRARNRKDIVGMLRLAGERRSDLVLFGEYANLDHRSTSPRKRDYTPESIPGDFTRLVARAARTYSMNVVMPMYGTWRGEVSSHAVVFDRHGAIAGCYQKSHATQPEQDLGMRRGEDLPVFRLDCAAIGIMTCMDIEYPEVAQVLMLRGAELLLFPHVQSSWGEVDWEIRYRARAIDTGLPLLSACYGYPEGFWMPGKMIGRTSLVGRDGLIIADMGRRIGVLTADLNIEQGRVTQFYFATAQPRTLAVVASRRPELYHDLVDTSTRARALKRLQLLRKGSSHG